jgi:hypothetical protein
VPSSLRAIGLALLLLAALGPFARASTPDAHALPNGVVSFSFFSPTKNIDCEMDTDRVGCGTNAPPQAVYLYPGGLLRTNAFPGDVGVDARVLPYGQSHIVGPFRCTMRTTGVTCVVTSTGRGFELARSGIRAVSALGPPSGQSVRFWDGKRAVARPTDVSYTGDGTGELVRVHWSTFGAGTATGTATDRTNDCTPDCANGSWTESPARVTLSRPITCHGRAVYSSVAIVDTTTPADSGRWTLFTQCTP